MPVDNALMQAHIHALRQIGDSMTSMNRRFDGLSEKVDDVRERVIGLEKSGYDVRLSAIKSDMDKMQSELNTLKSQRDQALGAMSLGTWLSKNAPWLLAGIAAFAAGLGFKLK
jgi:archaellum component FlaC